MTPVALGHVRRAETLLDEAKARVTLMLDALAAGDFRLAEANRDVATFKWEAYCDALVEAYRELHRP